MHLRYRAKCTVSQHLHRNDIATVAQQMGQIVSFEVVMLHVAARRTATGRHSIDIKPVAAVGCDVSDKAGPLRPIDFETPAEVADAEPRIVFILAPYPV